MDALTFAQRTREVLSTLFGSKLLVQLRADLEEARRERDYFRGRCERLELARDAAPQRPLIIQRPEHNLSPVGGHKSWKQVQREHTAKIQERLKAEEEAKRNAPKPSTN